VPAARFDRIVAVSTSAIPSIEAVGLGLRAPHIRHVLDTRPTVPWFEVHSENYFVDGGPALAALTRVRSTYPVALHGVGMSIASTDSLDRAHLAKLSRLIDRIDPWLVSEHLCFSGADGRSLNDLLPIPYTMEALSHVCARIDEVQHRLRRPIAIENISAYVAFPESEMAECEFVAAVVNRTGCRLLLDVNNVYVNAANHRFDPYAYIDAMPGGAIVEYHLAGFDATDMCLIDTHGAPVADDVWKLYGYTLERFGPRPTLIEWDTDLPAFAVLEAEAKKAQRVLEMRGTHAVAS
jgi:uncharacterized protein (UPF0276 family)